MNYRSGLAIAIVLVAGLTVTSTAVVAQTDPSLSDAANAAYLQKNAHKPGVIVLADGLQYNVLKAGAGGNHPAPNDQVDVLYSGTLINGAVFDRSDPVTPTTFRVYQLIAGWTEALIQMRPGDVWHLVIPASLAYGAKGTGDGLVPPNQTLVFDVELVAVHRSED